MGGAVIGWTNHVDAVATTLSAINPVTGIAAVMLRPLSQLQVPWVRGLCRGPSNSSGGHSSLQLRADLGSSKLINIIGLVGLNSSPSNPVGNGANCNFLLSNVAMGSSEVAAGAADFEYVIGTEFGQSLWYIPTAGYVSARYIEMNIECDGAAYVDIRRLLIMSGGQFESGFDSSFSITPADMSTSEDTPKGGVFVNENSSRREIRFSLSGMTLAEAKDNLAAYNNRDSLSRVLAAAGRRKEVVIAPRLESTSTYQFMNTIYGRLTEWGPVVHTGGDTYSCEGLVGLEVPYPPLS